MVTELGKFLRKLRIDNDELLKEMANKFGLASSSLSSIETGRRNPPKNFLNLVKGKYYLTDKQIQELEIAIMQSQDKVGFRIKSLAPQDQQLAVSFARKFENLSDADKARIREILSEADND